MKMELLLHKARGFIYSTLDLLKLELPIRLPNSGGQKRVCRSRKWTGNVIDLVELIYGLDEMKCINDGEITIQDLVVEFSQIYNIDIKDCYSSYVDIKRRKNDSRTYFLDKMAYRLNKRMEQDDEQESSRK